MGGAAVRVVGDVPATEGVPVQPDAVDPRQARVAMLLTLVGLVLAVTGAVMLAQPAAYAVLVLPATAFCAVLWRTRQ